VSYLVTAVYTALLAWGCYVGVRQIYQGYRHPEALLNPLFANRHALRLFVVHLVVATAYLFVVGPIALAQKSTLWFWGGIIALFTVSLPIAAYLNRNPETFGPFIGRWVRLRNYFEYAACITVASVTVNWHSYYLLLWWLVAYRLLDVGPRRALQRLYGSPERLAARPWAPRLTWAVIAAIYLLALLVVAQELVLYAHVPAASEPVHRAAPWEIAVVVTVNVGLAMFAWIGTKRYTDSLSPPAAATSGY
jgi:hypothetical protein